ncbi:hypothetical protein PHMEG_00038949 [Phytophthora megakarya]|uniref:Uncharacterized protein n=1 Tax=Phytophthora megakarya TaxID=4795 RepID=A0A225UGS9_9STRA|nr:hypothetical protein PHMEG_00038949 [Phytophthora megakarya]
MAAIKSKQPKVPEDWMNYGKTFVCTHTRKYKAHGKGRRKRQQSRMINCNAQINACVQAVAYTNPPVFKKRITSCWLENNHSLTYKPDGADNLTFLAKAGTKKKRIIQFIHENSKC